MVDLFQIALAIQIAGLWRGSTMTSTGTQRWPLMSLDPHGYDRGKQADSWKTIGVYRVWIGVFEVFFMFFLKVFIGVYRLLMSITTRLLMMIGMGIEVLMFNRSGITRISFYIYSSIAGKYCALNWFGLGLPWPKGCAGDWRGLGMGHTEVYSGHAQSWEATAWAEARAIREALAAVAWCDFFDQKSLQLTGTLWLFNIAMENPHF